MAEDNLRAIYQELCNSYRAIDDFRTKLLGFLPGPSPLNATPLTAAVWPFRVRSSRPLSTSHTFSVLSSDAETARRPSPLNATPLTPLETLSRDNGRSGNELEGKARLKSCFLSFFRLFVLSSSLVMVLPR
jgi:hypothetical protein